MSDANSPELPDDPNIDSAAPYQTPAPVASREVGAKKPNWPLRGLIAGAVLGILTAVALATPAGMLNRFLGFDGGRSGPPRHVIEFDANRGPVLEIDPPEIDSMNQSSQSPSQTP